MCVKGEKNGNKLDVALGRVRGFLLLLPLAVAQRVEHHAVIATQLSSVHGLAAEVALLTSHCSLSLKLFQKEKKKAINQSNLRAKKKTEKTKREKKHKTERRIP